MRNGKGFSLLASGMLLLLVQVSTCLAADKETVAMVTDLQGKATLMEDKPNAGLSILSEIKLGSHVQLNAGAHATIVYLQSGQEFELTGPAQIAFTAQQPETITGSKPAKRGVALSKSGKEIRIKPVVVAQAAIVMRWIKPGVKLKLLGPEGVELEASPLFQWQAPESGLKYRFELLDDSGKLLFATSVSEAQIRLPDTIRLQEAATYTWLISTQLNNGKQSSNAADFSIADAALREQVKQLQPAATAALSERVVFATWLEQMQLHREAGKYWKLIAAERQDDPRLKVLAGD